MLIQPRTIIPFGFERRHHRKYLLDVEFATAASAPISAYDGEVGRLLTVDTGSLLGVTGGEIATSGVGTGSGDPAVYAAAGFERRAGRTLRARWAARSDGGTTSSPLLGWLNSVAGSPIVGGAAMFGIRGSGTNLLAQSPGSVPALAASIVADTYDIYDFVLRNTGSFVFQNKALIWVFVVGSDAAMYPAAGNVSAGTRGFKIDYLRVQDIGAPFDSDYGIALVHTVAAVSGSDYTAAADLICDLVVTAPASLAGTAGLKFRKAGNDYWQAHFNSSGNLILQRYASGVAQGSPVTLATSVIAGSGVVTLRVIATGTKMDFYTLSGTTWTKRGSQQTDSVLNANTGASPFADGTWTSGGGSIGQLDAYARTDASYDGLDV